jgi:polyphosphate kinase
MIERIDREIHHHREHGGGHLSFKMNALVDKPCIKRSIVPRKPE